MTECTYCIVLCCCHTLTIVMRYGVTPLIKNSMCITVQQKRVVRLVCDAKRLEHNSTLFKQLCIFKCVDLVKFKTATITYNRGITKTYYQIVYKTCLSCMFQHMVLDREIPSEVIVCVQYKINVHFRVWSKTMAFVA